ncbi:MAG TPA: iron-sulfur cluster repair di-iron protein, partial [Clostridium sp.]|nr:iron-sulfur cluster repair di-iron protein [Clostridium sp.]
MNKFNSSQTVGEIVSIMPKASEIFKQYKIDFCCGGNRPLEEVLYELHLDENLILNKINEIFEESNNTKE